MIPFFRPFILALLLCWPGILLAEPVSLPQPPQLSARSWLLVDAYSGRVLASHNINQPLPLGSLTKLMTLYTLFAAMRDGDLSPDDEVQASSAIKQRAQEEGASIFVGGVERAKVLLLLRAVAITSANDAALALAEKLSGDESSFVDLMNRWARKIGLKNSHFLNCTGAPQSNHGASAQDMATLSQALMRDFPQWYGIFSERSLTSNGVEQPNRNRLIWSDLRVDGLKSGHTKTGGFNLAASAKGGGMRLIAVILGAPGEQSREEMSRRLLNYGFDNFLSVKPTESALPKSVPLFGGASNEMAIAPARPLWFTVPNAAKEQLAFRLKYLAPLHAPVRQGQKIGEIEAVYVNENSEQVLDSVDLLAAENAGSGFWLRRAFDKMLLWWRE